MSLQFVSKILIRGINPYARVSAAKARLLQPGWRRPMPVLVRINGKPRTPWRISMMPRGDGGFYLYLHGKVRQAAGVKVGDRVTVELRFDAAYRNGPMHPMPKWFSAALSRHPGARAAWDSLIPSRRKEVLRYFSSLKSEAARLRNLQRALRVLSGEPGRFMARNWKDGR